MLVQEAGRKGAALEQQVTTADHSHITILLSNYTTNQLHESHQLYNLLAAGCSLTTQPTSYTMLTIFFVCLFEWRFPKQLIFASFFFIGSTKTKAKEK